MHVSRLTLMAFALSTFTFGGQALSVDRVASATDGTGIAAQGVAGNYGVNASAGASLNDDARSTLPSANRAGTDKSRFINPPLVNNTPAFRSNETLLMSFTGTDIEDEVGLSGASFDNRQVALLSFSDLADFGLGNVVFTPRQGTFESAPVPFSAVPIPAPALMLIGALCGLALLARRRKTIGE